MKSFTLLMVGLLVSIFWLEARAGENVEEIRTAQPDGLVRIQATRGKIEIIGWDRAEVSIEGELDDLAESLLFEESDGETQIRVALRDAMINWGDGSDLTIHVPVGSRVQAESVSAEITLTDVVGSIAIRTVSGDVTASAVGSATQISTVSGDVELSDGSGMVKVSTSSGDASIELEATSITVNTVSGDFDLELGDFESLMASSVSGDLEVEGRLKPAGQIDASTVSGDLELTLFDPVNARIEARTGPGGEIENDLSSDEPEDVFPNTMSLDAKLGDGSGLVRLVTVSGEIRLDD